MVYYFMNLKHKPSRKESKVTSKSHVLECCATCVTHYIVKTECKTAELRAICIFFTSIIVSFI